MFPISGGVFLGWALGSNDAANVFGTAVASRIVRYSTAVILAAVFVIVGAVTGGRRGLETLSGITAQTPLSAFVVSVTAAAAVTLMTCLKLPVSTSQAVMGAIVGMGLGAGTEVNLYALLKVTICWVGTPLGAALACFLLYPLLARLMDFLRLSVVGRSFFIRIGLTVAGCYGAYALGANNVGNVTGVFCAAGMFDQPGALGGILPAALIGGGSIALGIVTFSRRVMTTVGSRVVPLDGFSALAAVLAAALTVHVYAVIGVPVSTSQAIVGAVLGIGLLKGMRTVNRRTLYRILFGWVAAPVIPGVICFCLAGIAL